MATKLASFSVFIQVAVSWIGRQFGLNSSTRLANANRVAHSFVVHRNKLDVFLRVLVDKHIVKRRRIDHEALRVLEFTVGLHLKAAVLAVAQMSDDLQTAVGQARFL